MGIGTSIRKRCQTEGDIRFNETDSKKSIENEDKIDRKSSLSSSYQSYSDKQNSSSFVYKENFPNLNTLTKAYSYNKSLNPNSPIVVSKPKVDEEYQYSAFSKTNEIDKSIQFQAEPIRIDNKRLDDLICQKEISYNQEPLIDFESNVTSKSKYQL